MTVYICEKSQGVDTFTYEVEALTPWDALVKLRNGSNVGVKKTEAVRYVSYTCKYAKADQEQLENSSQYVSDLAEYTECLTEKE